MKDLNNHHPAFVNLQTNAAVVDPVLQELQRDSRASAAELAELLNRDAPDLEARIKEWESNGTILGYQAVIDPDRAGTTSVAAVIEVKLTPEREGGFDRIARRISKFDQVSSCYLMSGGYDLMVLVEDETLREVARFVAEKLSSLDGVISTSTHFQLKVYKQSGFNTQRQEEDSRLAVSP
ncbi:MAG: DNA-binding Lrp family transcriptional regulator [Verrucomicrobiales bacterium]